MEVRGRLDVKWCIFHTIRGRSLIKLCQGIKLGGKTIFLGGFHHWVSRCTRLQERFSMLITTVERPFLSTSLGLIQLQFAKYMSGKMKLGKARNGQVGKRRALVQATILWSFSRIYFS